MHLQKVEMMELVAATGMWKYRCDILKRDVMDQTKGMGDKMDWETYFPGGRTPLDDVHVETRTERPRQGLLFNYVEDNPQPVQRSTIERILESLNNGEDVQKVLTTTVSPERRPTPSMSGRSLVEELIEGFASGETQNPSLTYDRQLGRWTYPDFFSAAYLQHAQ